MNRFIIEKAIIEKTNKDINTGCGYEFSSGLNLICGANEVGKSSLMDFINTALFIKNSGDMGKVFVKFLGQNYLVETKSKASSNIVYSLLDNKKIDSSHIKQHIPSKEFSYVFSISIDDLMCIKEKEAKAFIALMKDSSCEFLNSYIKQAKKNVDSIFGVRDVINNTSKLKIEINNLSKEIKEYSENEKNYNNVIRALNTINEELSELSSQKELVSLIDDIKNLDEKIDKLENEYKLLLVNFNSNLAKNSLSYLKLNEKSLDFNHNLKNIQENESQIDKLNSKILFSVNKLKKEFYIDLTEDKLNSFIINYSNVKQVSNSIEELRLISEDLKLYVNEKKDLTDVITDINKKIDLLNSKYKFSNSVEELEALHKYIDEGLKYFNYLQNQINENENQVVINTKGIISNKNLLVISCLISILTMISSIFAFYNKMYVIGTVVTIIFLLSAIIIYSLKIAIDKTKEVTELENNKIAKEKVIEDLKLKLKDVFPELLNMNQALMMLKIGDLKQEIYTKKEQLAEKIQEKTEKVKKLDKVNENINNLETNKNKIVAQNKQIVKSDFGNIELSENEYLQVIEIIDVVKDVICEKEKYEKINEELLDKNNEIQNEFKIFVAENKIEIPFEEDFSRKIEQLKIYYSENSKLNEALETLKIKIDGYKEQKEKLENKRKDISCNTLISSLELELEIANKNKLKEELLGQKHSLEHIKGLEDLKIKRNLIQAKYDSDISILFKNRIMLELCERAKNNFDKKQPNLQKAQEFLSIMTGGKYTKINIENEVIQNDDCTRIKEWKNLSRGTKELLYFALRLGFASNYSKDKVTLEPNGKLDLPLIIDDAFVNFDANRTKNAIKCLVEFSKTNQVLFFTCHSETIKKYIEECCEDFNVVNL